MSTYKEISRLTKKAAAISGIPLLLSGCANYMTWDYAYGHSVEHMVAEQTYDRTASSVDPLESMRPTDGAVGEKAIRVYRGSVAEPKEVREDITVNIGNSD